MGERPKISGRVVGSLIFVTSIERNNAGYEEGKSPVKL